MINMFTLDYDLKVSASYTYDIHLRAQIFELTQIIHNVRTTLKLDSLINFKNSHQYHPINKWAIASLNNYLHIVNYCNHLQDELHYRGYPNVHKCIEMIRGHNDNPDYLANKFDAIELTKYPQYMPPVFYHEDTRVAYRMYYFFLKRYKLPRGMEWYMRDQPYWYNYEYFVDNYPEAVLNIINSPHADFQKFSLKKTLNKAKKESKYTIVQM